MAGNIDQADDGDGRAATKAQLAGPNGIAVDSAGNLYIADTGNNRIRKVTTNGIISTVAGKRGASIFGGYGGDGGMATAAQLFNPGNVAVDTLGNLYIADTGNNRIRKVTIKGIIITVAGNGIRGYSGDGRIATAAQLNYPNGVAVDSVGNLYIADSLNYRIRKVMP
jgi:sugar lactone lactonase YvrE